MADSIETQAREKAEYYIEQELGLERHEDPKDYDNAMDDYITAFKVGATRPISQQELEAAVFVIQSFPNAEPLAIARAVARALGHVLEEPVGTPEREMK